MGRGCTQAGLHEVAEDHRVLLGILQLGTETEYRGLGAEAIAIHYDWAAAADHGILRWLLSVVSIPCASFFLSSFTTCGAWRFDEILLMATIGLSTSHQDLSPPHSQAKPCPSQPGIITAPSSRRADLIA